MADHAADSTITFTLDEVLTILRNVGSDVECGTCMEIAFTGGSSGHPHTCVDRRGPLYPWGDYIDLPANPANPLPNDAG